MSFLDTFLSFFRDKNEINSAEPPESAEDVMRAAFEKVMRSVEAPEPVKESFREKFLKAHQAGYPRGEENVAIAAFKDTGWIWHEYEKWKKVFQERGEYPYMWHRCSLTKEPPSKPTTIDEALKYLNVADMKEIIRANGIKRSPSPKKREDFEMIIKEELSFDHILPIISDSVEFEKKCFYERIEQGKCELLAHTLIMTMYGDRDRKRMTGRRYEVLSSGCPIEEEFADKFNIDEIKSFPPCFPGDRNGISRSRRDTSVK